MFFLINLVLGLVSVIANDLVVLKSYKLFIGKMAWFYCSSVLYVVLKHFYVNLIRVFEKINIFLINNNSGQVIVIAMVWYF